MYMHVYMYVDVASLHAHVYSCLLMSSACLLYGSIYKNFDYIVNFHLLGWPKVNDIQYCANEEVSWLPATTPNTWNRPQECIVNDVRKLVRGWSSHTPHQKPEYFALYEFSRQHVMKNPSKHVFKCMNHIHACFAYLAWSHLYVYVVWQWTTTSRVQLTDSQCEHVFYAYSLVPRLSDLSILPHMLWKIGEPGDLLIFFLYVFERYAMLLIEVQN